MIPPPSNPANSWCWNHVTVCGPYAQENNLNHISGNLGKVACQEGEVSDHTPKLSVKCTLEMRDSMGFSPKSPALPLHICSPTGNTRTTPGSPDKATGAWPGAQQVLNTDELKKTLGPRYTCIKNSVLEMRSTHNGILSSLQKEGHFDTCYNKDEPWGHYAKWNKPVTNGQILCGSTSMRSPEESNS